VIDLSQAIWRKATMSAKRAKHWQPVNARALVQKTQTKTLPTDNTKRNKPYTQNQKQNTKSVGGFRATLRNQLGRILDTEPKHTRTHKSIVGVFTKHKKPSRDFRNPPAFLASPPPFVCPRLGPHKGAGGKQLGRAGGGGKRLMASGVQVWCWVLCVMPTLHNKKPQNKPAQ
jgi:hypothetical protein